MSPDVDEAIERTLDRERIAVVGCSSTPGKAAHDVPRYLADHGYEIQPVNPYADELFGRGAVDSLADLTTGVDVVCIFRPSEEVNAIVDETLVETDAGTIWTQLGISDDEAVTRARSEGLTVVQDRCMKVEHRRLRG